MAGDQDVGEARPLEHLVVAEHPGAGAAGAAQLAAATDAGDHPARVCVSEPGHVGLAAAAVEHVVAAGVVGDELVVALAAEQTVASAGTSHEGIVTAGVHRASSIKVAEAAKVIENTQRDLNIALMNELAILFDRIGIDTLEVLQAAGTKWNFLPFRPGLVGGHCIGVDPYYLTHKADMLGYHPQVILAGRRINDGMGRFIAEQTVKHMIRNGSPVKGAQVNVLGLTFKEDCSDIRNTRVIDLVRELQSYGAVVHVHDPLSDAGEARHEYGLELEPWEALPRAEALVVAVAHRQFVARPPVDFLAKVVEGGCFIDVKSRFDLQALQQAGVTVWRL